MSTNGLVMLVDLLDEAATDRFRTRFTSAQREHFADELTAALSRVVDRPGGVRLEINAQDMVASGAEERIFRGASRGRAVVCEDADQYGILFQVWKLDPVADSTCVYCAYVPYPGNQPESRSASRVLDGPAAAAAAAELYGVDPEAMTAVDDDRTAVSATIGVVGTPFTPWLEALGVTWPDP
ncbi:hypothetical protein [Gordonia caeni]|uniref:Transposase n=1 Tax=Gordonia caeni TaxID=1007097 RepID=A0ABP7NL97_9ACTN